MLDKRKELDARVEGNGYRAKSAKSQLGSTLNQKEIRLGSLLLMNRYSIMIRYLYIHKKQHIKLGTKNSTFNYSAHSAQTFAYAVSKPKVSGVNQFHEKPQKCYKYVPTPKTQNPHLTRKFEVTSVCGRKGGFYGVICCKFSGGESREGFSSGSSVECMRRSDRGSSSSHSTTICQVNPKRAQRMA